MVPSRFRFLSVVPLLSAIGCGALLGISPGDPQGDDEGGRGGSSPAGSGGNGDGGNGDGGNGDGGNGDGGAGDSSGATTGGTGKAGSVSTGGSGGHGGNAGSSAGGSAGMGGGAGEGAIDASDFPQPGDPCSAWGALACWFPDPDDPQPTRDRLLCDRGRWVIFESCPGNPANQRCDRRDGACRGAVCQRPGVRPGQCFGSSVFVCGPDLVTEEYVPCIFGCSATGDCKVAGPGQLIIDQPRSIQGSRNNPWPERLIPVCWREFSVEDPAILDLRAHVRVAVERLWSRESVVGFTGWGSCDTSQARVELDFADDCEGELARIPRNGYPGAATALPVTLCKSYYDFASPPMRHPRDTDGAVELELLGFVAQHVFGHVLGLEDVPRDPNVGMFMDPALDGATFLRLRPESWLLTSLADWYGNAPGRSLVSPNGRCLSYHSDSGVLSASVCDGSDAQAWEPRDNALAHGSGKCIRAASEDAIQIADCNLQPLEEEKWLPAGVRIRDRLDRCLIAGTPPTYLALQWHGCDVTWPPEERFHLEFVGPGRVRIRTTHATPSCIVAPEMWAQRNIGGEILTVPDFGPCDGIRAVFDAVDGTLGQQGRCLTMPLSTLYTAGLVVFEPCGKFWNQQFRLSGPFEHEGRALTLPIESQNVTLTSTPLGPFPTPDQIFDYRF